MSKTVNVTDKDRAAYWKLRKTYGFQPFMGAMAIAVHDVPQQRLDRLVTLQSITDGGFGNYICKNLD